MSKCTDLKYKITELERVKASLESVLHEHLRHCPLEKHDPKPPT